MLAAIDRDIGAGHERRPVRAQVDDKTCNFFGLAEASERDLRQDLSWDSPDDSRTGVNIIAFPSSLEDRREVRTATGTLGQPERWSSGRSGHFPWHWHGSIRRDCLDHVVVLGDRLAGCCKLDRKRNSVQFSQISATIAASASVSSNSFMSPPRVPRTIGGEVESLGSGKLPRCGRLSSGDRRCTCSPSVRNARGWSPEPARPAPPKRVDGQSRSGLDYMLAVVKYQQHLPPYASVVTTTESKVTEITET